MLTFLDYLNFIGLWLEEINIFLSLVENEGSLLWVPFGVSAWVVGRRDSLANVSCGLIFDLIIM